MIIELTLYFSDGSLLFSQIFVSKIMAVVWLPTFFVMCEVEWELYYSRTFNALTFK